MALASVGFTARATFKDTGGDTTSRAFDLTAADVASAVTAANALVADWAAATKALVSAMTITEKFAEDTLVYPAAQCEIENLAAVTVVIDDPQFKTHTFYVPAPIDGLFVDTQGPNFNAVDPTATELQDLLINYETGGIAQVSDGEQIKDASSAGNVKGKRIHKKSNKG